MKSTVKSTPDSTLNSILESAKTSRRNFTVYGIASLISAGLIGKTFAATSSAPLASAMTSQDVSIENFSEAGKSEGTTRVAKIVKTDAEWKNLLSSDSYQVTRHEGTERPYSGKYEHNHADGIYRCICCNTAVFDSRTKFESGTGWPSFWQPISRLNVLETTDRSLGMSRTAVSCRLCNAHLGHVFDDGPKPTGLRYCMNSVSLNFAARA